MHIEHKAQIALNVGWQVPLQYPCTRRLKTHTLVFGEGTYLPPSPVSKHRRAQAPSAGDTVEPWWCLDKGGGVGGTLAPFCLGIATPNRKNAEYGKSLCLPELSSPWGGSLARGAETPSPGTKGARGPGA